MNEDEPNKHAELVHVEPGTLALTSLAENRILTEMVGASLVLARDSAITSVDLDAVVREGKRLYCGVLNKIAGRIVVEDWDFWGAFDLRTESDLWTEQEPSAEDTQAFALFLRTAEAGHVEAQCIVAMCYLWGHGVQRDEDEQLVVKWLRKAGESGFAEAQFRLGLCYRYGQGVQRNYHLADKWLRLAAVQGHIEAQYWLGATHAEWHRIFEAAEDGALAEHRVESAKWYRKAAEQNHTDAQGAIGHLYQRGIGVPENKFEAYKWFRLASCDEFHEKHERFKQQATSLADAMSPSELETAYALCREFWNKQSSAEAYYRECCDKHAARKDNATP